MDPRRAARAWICLAALCSGAALVLAGEDEGDQSLKQPDHIPVPEGAPNSTAGEGGELAARTSGPPWTPGPPRTSGPPWTSGLPQVGAAGPSAPPTRAGAAGNSSQNRSAVPVRYWSPVIFVAVALLVLFLTYRRTKGDESSNQAASVSDSSDLGEPANTPILDTAPIIPAAEEEQKGPENPPKQDPNETTFCEPGTPPPQPLPGQVL